MSDAQKQVELLLETTDALVWAEEFMKNFGDRLNEIDTGLMIGWFANAFAAKESTRSTDDEDGMVAHARKELERIYEDSDVVEWMLGVIRSFAAYGHSGGSVATLIPQLTRLLEQKNLSPLTTNADEWEFRDPSMWPPNGIWQNTRNSECFSEDGGKTFWVLSNPYVNGHRPIYTSVEPGEETEGNIAE